MHFLIIHPSLPPASHPEGICTSKLIDALRAGGARVTVLTAPPEGANGRVASQVDRIEVPGLSPETLTEKIDRTFHHYPESGWRWAKRAAARTSEFIERERVDVIYSRAMPMLSNVVAHRTRRPAGVAWIAHFSDPWPPEGYAGNRHDNWRDRWHQRLIRACDAATFPCQRVADYCRQHQWGAGEPRAGMTLVLPHVFSGGEPETRASVATDAPHVFLHCGSFYGARQPDALVAGWAKFLAQHPEARSRIRLWHVGPKSDRLDELATREGVRDTVEQKGPCSYAESLRYMTAAAAALVLVDSAELRTSIYLPSKFVDYVWARRPILALTPADGTVADLLGADYPLRADPWDADGATRAIAATADALDRPSESIARRLDSLRNPFTPSKVSADLIEFATVVVERRGQGAAQSRV